jgi:hypothetical protein
MSPSTPARRARASGSSRLPIAKRLSKMLKRQVDALEAEPDEGFSEPRVKALMLLAKTLQAMEVVEQKTEKAANADTSNAEDIVEFRSQLERQLQALESEREP